MRLSLAMIVKNETFWLEGCLASVRGLVDEVVVADTGSTDGTQDLARRLGAQVLDIPWTDDFSAARNAALAACTGDWILVLDADERLEAEDHDQVRRAMATPDIHAWRLWLRNYMSSGAFAGAGGAVRANTHRRGIYAAFPHVEVSRRLRLFRAQGEPVFQGRVHELADPHFEQRGLAMGDLDVSIHHLGKVDMGQERAKQPLYLRLSQQDAADRPDDPQCHWNVMWEALVLEAWPEALQAAEAFLALRPLGNVQVRLGAARALLGLDRPAEALEHAEAALAARPGDPHALCLQGEALGALGRLEPAMAALAQAMNGEPGFTLPYLKAAGLLQAAEQLDTARKVLEAGLDQNAEDLHLWEALVAHSARFEPDQAPRDAWDALQAVPHGGKGIWHQLVALTLLGMGHPDDAREVARRGLAVFPASQELLELADRLAEGAGQQPS